MQALRSSSMIVEILASAALGAPFLYLQLRYANPRHAEFPYALFTLLWVTAAGFVFTGAPLMRTMFAGESVFSRPGLLMGRLSLLIILAIVWSSVISDHMPCFLGAPNCD
jgi:Na+/H+ antiporter NhaC